MEQNKANWLPHLPYEVVEDARGWNLDAYVVALEGWRRGLTLKWHTKDYGKFKEMRTWFVDSPGRLFSLSSEDKTHYFFRTRGDLVTNKAVDIGGDKDRSKQHLKKANVPIPEGKEFGETATNESIISYANEIGFPVVLKPTDGSFGRGVVTNIEDEKALIAELTNAREVEKYDSLIVEQHIPGDDYRIYVVGDEAVAAMKRIPANVTGDGEKTIRELIQLKNEEKELNPRLVSCQIKIDEETTSFIKAQGYTLDSILEQDKLLYLSDKSNISLGGDPISTTKDMPEEVMDTAVRALQSVPGLTHGAVDLIIDSRKPMAEAATIIELNPTAQLGGLLYPVEGEANDVPAAIIDYYFPERERNTKFHKEVYFDFNQSILPLYKQTAITVQVQGIDFEEINSLIYTLESPVKIQSDKMGQRIRRLAKKYNMVGSISINVNQEIEIVIAGDKESQNLFIEDVKALNLNMINAQKYNRPIKLGFEIKAAKQQYIDTILYNDEKLNRLKNEQKKLEKRYNQMLNSNSWKISAPIRMITGLLK